jgi:hypothetical protein
LSASLCTQQSRTKEPPMKTSSLSDLLLQRISGSVISWRFLHSIVFHYMPCHLSYETWI